MADIDHEAIMRDPHYRMLTRSRDRLAGWLTGAVLAAYFGFILLVAFGKPLLARPVGTGVTSLGIVLGVGLIVLAIALTGLYIRRANRAFDPLVERLRADHGR